MNIEIAELWSTKVSPSSLYNIERALDDNPTGGGGQGFIQVSKGLVDDLLLFLREQYPNNGTTIDVEVGNFLKPTLPKETLTFASKSAGRMRIPNQNRHRSKRLSAWSPEVGFPVLKAGQKTPDAEAVLAQIGEVHIFLVRGVDESLWAGFTAGEASKEEAKHPFASIVWGAENPGGYWKYEEDK